MQSLRDESKQLLLAMDKGIKAWTRDQGTGHADIGSASDAMIRMMVYERIPNFQVLRSGIC
jgi:hypothetical protein